MKVNDLFLERIGELCKSEKKIVTVTGLTWFSAAVDPEMEIVAASRRQREFLKFIRSLATNSYLWGNPPK